MVVVKQIQVLGEVLGVLLGLVLHLLPVAVEDQVAIIVELVAGALLLRLQV